MLKMSDIKEWGKDQVEAKVADLRNQLFTQRMQKSVSGVEKPHQLRDMKKDIARLLTVLNSKGSKNGK